MHLRHEESRRQAVAEQAISRTRCKPAGRLTRPRLLRGEQPGHEDARLAMAQAPCSQKLCLHFMRGHSAAENNP